MAQSDWTKAPIEIIKDLVALANPAFTAVRESFSVKDAVTAESGDKNANVTLYPTNVEDYTGEVTIAYTRIGLIPFMDGKGIAQTVPYGHSGDESVLTLQSTESEMLTAIAIITDLHLVEGDLTDLTITQGESDTTLNLSFNAAENNFLFIGSALIGLDQSVPKTQTSSIITATDLSGLDTPTA